jgi:hypothetical protein
MSTKGETNENVIPNSLASVVTAVEFVCAELASKGDFRAFGSERWIRNVMLAWDDQIQHLAFVLDAGMSLLAVYVILRLSTSSNYRDSLEKAIARANYGLLPGCFEININNGEVRYRSVLNLLSSEISTRDVAQLLTGALLMTRTYAPAFQEIILSGVDPIEVIEKIES